MLSPSRDSHYKRPNSKSLRYFLMLSIILCDIISKSTLKSEKYSDLKINAERKASFLNVKYQVVVCVKLFPLSLSHLSTVYARPKLCLLNHLPSPSRISPQFMDI